jgi:endonuclease III related protein
MPTSEKLMEIYNLLYDAFGPQHWWPGDTQIEIAAGAILTQNTSWANVKKAITNLKNVNCLSAQKLHELKIEELAELIRPAGYYNIKAKRLKNFINWFFKEYSGDFRLLDDVNTNRLRDELLSINGVGRETADSILLYALERPIFVIDAYTARIAVRHHLIDPDADYEELRYLFESNLRVEGVPPSSLNNSKRGQDTRDTNILYNEFHALLVRTGYEFCKLKPRCEQCPLEKLSHTIDIEYF